MAIKQKNKTNSHQKKKRINVYTFSRTTNKKDFWQVDGSEVDMKGICI